MDMIIFKRTIQEKIESALFKGDMVVLYGPRQSGKTTLSKKILEKYKNNGQYYDCQIADVRRHFVVGEPDKLLEMIKGKKIVVFDEAQTIVNIGTILKVFHDTYRHSEIQVIATGSSSFDLANKIVEPMTGRALEFNLLPLSLSEIRSVKKDIILEDIYSMMLYGNYPAVVASGTVDEKELAIKKIATNYLYKDIFILESVKNSKAFEDILKMLALQIGQMVSTAEISRAVGVSRATVDKYIRLLELSFVVKRVYSFSNNPRTELKKAYKVFFLDLGVRNAIVDIITKIEDRGDKGAIFENFFMTEILKYEYLKNFPGEIMFWRTRAGLEVDFIIKNGKEIRAVECKWKNTEVSFKEFLKKYKEAKTEVVTPESFLIGRWGSNG